MVLAFLSRVFGMTMTYSSPSTVKKGVIVDRRAKIVPLPVERDITRTKEFWDKAVPS